MKKAYIERYVLGVLVALVGSFVLANPLGWDPAQRIASFVAISAASLLAAILLEGKKRRTSASVKNVRNCCITALLISGIWFGLDSMKQDRGDSNRSTNSLPPTVKQETHGQDSPAIANVGGDVNIDGKSKEQKKAKGTKK